MLFWFAVAILSAGFAYYFWISLRYFTHMLQLNSYYNRRYLKWLRHRQRREARFLLAAMIVSSIVLRFFLARDIYLFLHGLVFLGLALRRKRIVEKKPLVYTWRVRRLLISEAAVFCLAFLISAKLFALTFWWELPFLLAFYNFLAPLLILAANLINRQIEKSIAKGFVRDAKKILAEHPGLTVIGVTGSYGKTSTKKLLYQLLNVDFQVLATPESYNTTMGVVRTIREKLTAAHQVFIVEMGAKKSGDIKEICNLVEPAIGILSSIGEMHLDTFHTIENIIQTKFELAEAVGEKGIMFLNYDNHYIREHDLSQPAIRYGLGRQGDVSGLDVWADQIVSGPSGSQFDLCFVDGAVIHCKTRLLGELNVLNIAAAAAVTIRLGIAPERLGQLISQLEPIQHRLQLLPPGSRYQIIDDAFNANPEGANQALETLSGFPGFRVLITPGMVELGDHEEELNRQLGRQAAGHCDYIIIVGENRSFAIKGGALQEGYDEGAIYIAKDIQDALRKADALSIDPGRKAGPMTVLLENDLPDNFLGT
ncbi:MAG: UDP-N-acetylmuramoyl-tripeptide--D-alanyl-D-alanine ligase [Peptococcaceae bacterium]|jgi:UDP-N-acetylmuramoyl-tripeptide--D-alanyl-D-alanine ligase|nr:UDP-N-acetylmuramoyl-tripeptide--D-alanyl-D-alanine ligase [Peptococcaceae bacterium]